MSLALPQSLEPVIVIVHSPEVLEGEVDTVIIEVAEDPGVTVTELGLKLTETPEGKPEAERSTVIDDAEALAQATVTVAVVEDPGSMVSPEGLTDIEKSLT